MLGNRVWTTDLRPPAGAWWCQVKPATEIPKCARSEWSRANREKAPWKEAYVLSVPADGADGFPGYEIRCSFDFDGGSYPNNRVYC